MTTAQRPRKTSSTPKPQPRRRLDLVPQFYLDLEDAEMVVTDTLVAIKDTIVETVEARAMSLIYGDPGLGKTFSTKAALQEMDPDLVLTLDLARSNPGPKDLREELFHQMHLKTKMPGTPTAFDRLLREALPRRPYVIVADEAQQYNRVSFEFLRKLWDNCRPRPAIVFIGSPEAYTTLQSDPALASRLYMRQEILAMSEDDVLTIIPESHPVWRGVEAGLLQHLDGDFAQGSFREWAKATRFAVKGLKRFKTDQVDRALIDWVLSQVVRTDYATA